MGAVLKFESPKREKFAGPHPMEDLSFMRPHPQGFDIDFWNVETTGDFHSDCSRGRHIATEFLGYIGKHPTNFNAHLLGWIVADMIEDGAAKGLVIGFMNAINEYAMSVARLIHDAPEAPS